MSNLIERQAAIDVIDSYEVDAPDYMQGWAVKLIEAIKGDIRGLISELPSAQTIDAVEVVRCKDCVALQYCRFAQGLGLDGFCSQGERRG